MEPRPRLALGVSRLRGGRCTTIAPGARWSGRRESHPHDPPWQGGTLLIGLVRMRWSGWRVLPPRPSVPQTDALLAELHPAELVGAVGLEPHLRGQTPSVLPIERRARVEVVEVVGFAPTISWFRTRRDDWASLHLDEMAPAATGPRDRHGCTRSGGNAWGTSRREWSRRRDSHPCSWCCKPVPLLLGHVDVSGWGNRTRTYIDGVRTRCAADCTIPQWWTPRVLPPVFPAYQAGAVTIWPDVRVSGWSRGTCTLTLPINSRALHYFSFGPTVKWHSRGDLHPHSRIESPEA